MKIKINVDSKKYTMIHDLLIEKGFEIDENADFVISENQTHLDYLILKGQDGEKKQVSAMEIMYLEAFDHDIEARTINGLYFSLTPLGKTAEQLDPKLFLRISNSVVINRKYVKEIIPTFAMKFLLVMKDGQKVTVTRSYYNDFRNFFGI